MVFRYRDVFWKGTCDDGAMRFAELLGWKKELEELIEREHAVIEKKQTESLAAGVSEKAPSFVVP